MQPLIVCVDGYDDDHKGAGFNLTESDYIDYMRFLAEEAASLNLSIGLKNSLAILDDVQDVIQFAVNEQAVSMEETDKYDKFLGGKYNGTYGGIQRPVFNVEYVEAYAGSKNQSKSLVASMVQEGKPTDRNLTAGLLSSYCSQNRTLSTITKLQSLNGWRLDCDRKEYWTPVNITAMPNKLKPAISTCLQGKALNSTSTNGTNTSFNSSSVAKGTKTATKARTIRKSFKGTWLYGNK